MGFLVVSKIGERELEDEVEEGSSAGNRREGREKSDEGVERERSEGSSSGRKGNVDGVGEDRLRDELERRGEMRSSVVRKEESDQFSSVEIVDPTINRVSVYHRVHFDDELT